MRHTILLTSLLFSLTSCGGSTTGPAGHVVITGTAFSNTIRQGENGTLNFTVTNAGATTIQFDANMCPGTLQVLDAQQQLVFDSRFFPTSCGTFTAPTTLAPGDVYRWQEGFPAVFIAAAGAPSTTPAPGTYSMLAGRWFWTRFGAVESTPVVVQIVP